MTAAGAGAAAGAAAAAAARARQQEEEEMTAYTREELIEGWEFKIVRANTHAFRKPEVLRRVVAEEAQAGWILLEKFDDARLRFKRPLSARQSDESLAIDPYRTIYGIGQGAIVAIVLSIIGGIVVISAGLAAIFGD